MKDRKEPKPPKILALTPAAAGWRCVRPRDAADLPVDWDDLPQSPAEFSEFIRQSDPSDLVEEVPVAAFALVQHGTSQDVHPIVRGFDEPGDWALWGLGDLAPWYSCHSIALLGPGELREDVVDERTIRTVSYFAMAEIVFSEDRNDDVVEAWRSI